MKQKLSKILIATLVFACMAGLTPAMAASPAPIIDETGGGIVTPFRDEFITYYRTVNGVNQYRIWNATRGEWTMPWTNCTL